MAAPVAVIRAAPGSDHRDRPFAVMLAPNFQITGNIDLVPIGPRLRIQIRDGLRGACAPDLPCPIAEDESRNRLPGLTRETCLAETLQRDLALARDNQIRPGFQVLAPIV